MSAGGNASAGRVRDRSAKARGILGIFPCILKGMESLVGLYRQFGYRRAMCSARGRLCQLMGFAIPMEFSRNGDVLRARGRLEGDTTISAEGVIAQEKYFPLRISFCPAPGRVGPDLPLYKKRLPRRVALCA